MIKYYALLVLCCAGITASAQVTVKGHVTTTASEKLAFVSIGVPNTTEGTVSDDNGNFDITISPAHAKDTLMFSYVGFKDVKFPLTMIKYKIDDLQIKLAPASTELRNVTVTATKGVAEKIGSTHIKGVLSNTFAIKGQPGENLGSEIGETFKLSDKQYAVNQLNVYINNNDYDTTIFRVNVYSIKDGMPEKNLLTSNILLPIYNKQKGWVALDLKPYNLSFNQDVVVSLQWVKHSVKGSALTLPIKMPLSGKVHYYKYGSQGVWKTFNNMSTPINLDVVGKG